MVDKNNDGSAGREEAVQGIFTEPAKRRYAQKYGRKRNPCTVQLCCTRCGLRFGLNPEDIANTSSKVWEWAASTITLEPGPERSAVLQHMSARCWDIRCPRCDHTLEVA